MNILDFDKPSDRQGKPKTPPRKPVRRINSNPVLTDPGEAIALLAKIFGQEKDAGSNVFSYVKTIKKDWYDFFKRVESLDLPQYSLLYKQAMELCNKLLNLDMATSIFDKTVLGLGGQFSSGKSAFINTIAGLNDLLYVNQLRHQFPHL